MEYKKRIKKSTSGNNTASNLFTFREGKDILFKVHLLDCLAEIEKAKQNSQRDLEKIQSVFCKDSV